MKKQNKKAYIYSAVKLSDEYMDKIYKLFPNLKNKEVESIVDNKLIGGFIVRQESDIFDASISGKINYLLSKLYENYR